MTNASKIFLFVLTNCQILFQISILRYLDVALNNFQTVFYSAAVIFSFSLGGFFSATLSKKISTLQINYGIILISLISHVGLILGNSVTLALLCLGLSLLSCSLFGIKIMTVFRNENANFFELLIIDLIGCLSGFMIHIIFVDYIGPMTLMTLSYTIFWFLDYKNLRSNLIGTVAWVILIALSFKLDWSSITPKGNKWIKDNSKILTHENTYWDKFSKIDVYKRISSTTNPIFEYYYDGSSMSTWLYTWNLTKDEFYKSFLDNKMELIRSRGIIAPYVIQDFNDKNICVIGAGAGQEVKIARLHNPSHIYVSEVSKLLIKALNQNEFFRSNNLYSNNSTTLFNISARSVFNQKSKFKCDLIQAISTYSTAGASSRQGALEPSFNLTSEALKGYLSTLTENGIFQAEFVFYPELLLSLMEATNLTESSLEKHLIILEHQTSAYKNLVLYRKLEFTTFELNRIKNDLIRMGLSEYIFVTPSNIISTFNEKSKASGITINAITDNRPYPMVGFTTWKPLSSYASEWAKHVPIEYTKVISTYFYTSLFLYICFFIILFFINRFHKYNWLVVPKSNLTIIISSAASQILLCQWYSITSQLTSQQPLASYYTISILSLTISSLTIYIFHKPFQLKIFISLISFVLSSLFYMYLSNPEGLLNILIFFILYSVGSLSFVYTLNQKASCSDEKEYQLMLYLLAYLSAFIVFPIAHILSPFFGTWPMFFISIAMLMIASIKTVRLINK